MQQVDVVWLVEHVARELDVACAVRHLAGERYGTSIQVVPINTDAARIAATYQPRVVTIPYGFSAANAGLRNFLVCWRDAIYLNLSWEQLFYKAYLAAKAPNDTWSRQHVVHHAWGEFYCRYLLQHGVPREHIFVNGQPAYKMYDEPYRRFFVDRAELARRHALDSARRWVFFPENYGWAFRDRNFLRTIAAEGQLDWDTLQVMKVFCEDSLRQVVRWIRDVAADGSAEVILRARPATRQSDFEKFVREVAGPLPRRLRIIKEGTVREWIMASDVVASSYSTSLIEAAVAGKPAYMVEPLPIPDPLDAAWYVHAPRLTTRNQFVSACLETVDAASDDRLGKWARAELLGTGDPISNLADVLHRLCTSTMTRPPVPAAETIGVPGRTPTQRIRSQLHASVSFLRTIGSRANGVSSPDSRHDEFDDAEVARRTTAFGRILTQGSRPAHLSQPL